MLMTIPGQIKTRPTDVNDKAKSCIDGVLNDMELSETILDFRLLLRFQAILL